MIQKGTYGSSFQLRCYPFPEGNIDPEQPQRRGGRCATSDPPPGPQIDDLGGVAQGFSDGHGRGHVSGKNLNNHRAKRGLWVLHRLLHQLLHQVECYVAPILGPGTGVLKASWPCQRPAFDARGPVR